MGQVASPVASGGQVFLSRAPILSRRQQVLGYQLHVGRQTGPRLPEESGQNDLAPIARVIENVGIGTLTHGQPAFVRVGRRELLGGAARALPSRDVILEFDAGLDADGAVKEACDDLRGAGYRLAIDDFDVRSPAADLATMAHYLKIDVSDPRAAESRARTVACFRHGVTTLVAKGVETPGQMEAASQDGFEFFQGYFFDHPVMQPDRRISPQQVTLLRLLRALNDQNLSIDELEDLVKHDSALCFRMLRAVNSAAAARRHTISSIREALLLLGRDTVRRWASLSTVAGLSTTAPGELVIMSTVRARLCELLAGSQGANEQGMGEAFLLGMCSLLDAILGKPMDAIVKDLPLSESTSLALCGQPSPARSLLDCAVAYERGRWAECEAIAQRARVNAAVLPGAFLEALRWAKELQEPLAERTFN